MSASGVDKSRLQTIGRDILLVTGYEPDRLMMRLSVPPNVEPRRVSAAGIDTFYVEIGAGPPVLGGYAAGAGPLTCYDAPLIAQHIGDVNESGERRPFR